jgi:outer membrane protein assembly factor BamB
VSGNHIYITDAGSRVWALDRRTGATLWRQDGLTGRELSAPAVQGRAVVVGDFDGYVHWLSQDDGEIIARKNLDKVWSEVSYVWEDEESDDDAVRRSISATPVVADGTLYVRDNRGALIAFTVSQ